MEQVDQAIFTSAQTERAGGYQVVASSDGACDADLRELAAWCPSHDSLLAAGPDAASVNFHPLPSGRYCVGRTTPAGVEYSGRGGLRVYTQCLLVPPAVLARFANNPFAVLRAAVAAGAVRVHETIPRKLEPLRLAGRAAAVDAELLARLRVQPGAEWIASLVQAALDAVTIALAGGPPPEHVVAGLLNCLPPECRTEFSFSTGLRFSSRRPFRIVALAGDREEQRRFERLYNAAVLRLDGAPPDEFAPVEGWPRFVHRTLKSGRLSFLANRLAQCRADVALNDLPALGLQLLEELDAAAFEAPTEATEVSPAATADPARAAAKAPSPNGEIRRGHAPHAPPAGPPAPPKPDVPPASKALAAVLPEFRSELQRLDALVAAAIADGGQAVDGLRREWLRLAGQWSETLLSHAREEYLRYALALWRGMADAVRSQQPERAGQSLDVLCILFAAGDRP